VFTHSISGSESYVIDKKRPLRSLALEPNFGKRGSRAVVCGGMAGTLVLHEKGWLGYKETLLHLGEGPIWHIRWRGTLIAWANDVVSVHACDLRKLTPNWPSRASKYMTLRHNLGSPISKGNQIARVQIFSNAPSIGKMIPHSSSLGQILSRLLGSGRDRGRQLLLRQQTNLPFWLRSLLFFS
jgi:hypothetical protein